MATNFRSNRWQYRLPNPGPIVKMWTGKSCMVVIVVHGEMLEISLGSLQLCIASRGLPRAWPFPGGFAIQQIRVVDLTCGAHRSMDQNPPISIVIAGSCQNRKKPRDCHHSKWLNQWVSLLSESRSMTRCPSFGSWPRIRDTCRATAKTTGSNSQHSHCLGLGMLPSSQQAWRTLR